jgi:hypothetical protein
MNKAKEECGSAKILDQASFFKLRFAGNSVEITFSLLQDE